MMNLNTIMILNKTKNDLLTFKGYFRLYKIKAMKEDKQGSYHFNTIVFEQILNQCQYGVKLWNSLNDDLETCEIEYCLKTKYKENVFKEYQNTELRKETSTVQLYILCLYRYMIWMYVGCLKYIHVYFLLIEV